MNKRTPLRALTEGAVMVAIAQVLSLIKLWEMPWGGSVVLAMVPIILYAVRWGLGKGLLAAFAFGVLQFAFDGGFAIGWQSILGDYLAAFTALAASAGPVTAVTSKNVSDLPAWISKSTLEGMLSSADFVTLHCPLTATNRHMINADTLGLMHPGAVLINTGRGPLVDEAAVADALREGRLGAYCADVMSSEPPKADNPLLTCDNAFITPHIAWATKEARQRLMNIATANIKAFIEGNPINTVR